jgi:hypothetical protein
LKLQHAGSICRTFGFSCPQLGMAAGALGVVLRGVV